MKALLSSKIWVLDLKMETILGGCQECLFLENPLMERYQESRKIFLDLVTFIAVYGTFLTYSKMGVMGGNLSLNISELDSRYESLGVSRNAGNTPLRR